MNLTIAQLKALKQIASNLSSDGHCLDSSGIRPTCGALVGAGFVTTYHIEVDGHLHRGIRITQAGRAFAASL